MAVRMVAYRGHPNTASSLRFFLCAALTRGSPKGNPGSGPPLWPQLLGAHTQLPGPSSMLHKVSPPPPRIPAPTTFPFLLTAELLHEAHVSTGVECQGVRRDAQGLEDGCVGDTPHRQAAF